MSLEVISSGFLSLLQDFGRYGLQRNGITHGGPLDEHAFLWANRLLNNHYNAAQIEISFGGFAARFTKKTMMTVCGADLSATLNNKSIPLWETIVVNPGDELRFTSPRSGLRAYLSVKGGFDVTKHLGSSATVAREKLGGLKQNGEKLAEKEVLPYTAYQEEVARRVPLVYIPQYEKSVSLRFIPNRSVTGCSYEAINEFIQQKFKVSSQLDRMGYRLEGQAISNVSSGIISQGISLGTIQLPKDGQPIVLMKDRQTMGGYPQLGCVAYMDLSLLAQSMPGTELTFIPVTIDELEEELMAHKRFFHLDL
ncbi:MAG: biotin-dependent carboxyltransferase family protein [Cellvibrionaceae bacterium]